MFHPDLLAEKKKIDDLLGFIATLDETDPAKSLLTAFACVRVSGSIENSVRIIVGGYCETRSSDYTREYVRKKLKKFPNPNYDNILGLLADFDDSWNTKYKALLSSQERSALNSINSNRNTIAHGGSTSLSLSQLRAYYADVVKAISALELTVK